MRRKKVVEGVGKRKRWSASEKLRIVLAGLEPGNEISELCRREGLNPTMYYQRKRQLLGAAERIFEKKEHKPSARDQRLSAELTRAKDVIAEKKRSRARGSWPDAGGATTTSTPYCADREGKERLAREADVGRIGGLPRQLFTGGCKKRLGPRRKTRFRRCRRSRPSRRSDWRWSIKRVRIRKCGTGSCRGGRWTRRWRSSARRPCIAFYGRKTLMCRHRGRKKRYREEVEKATNALRDEIQKGSLRGPHIASARMVDGDPPIRGRDVATVVASPDDARRAVESIKSEGYDFIKVYSRIELEVFRELLNAARAHGVRVIGHIPARERPASEVLLPGFVLVAHCSLMNNWRLRREPPAF